MTQPGMRLYDEAVVHAVNGSVTPTMGKQLVWAFAVCQPNRFQLCREVNEPVTCLTCLARAP